MTLRAFAESHGISLRMAQKHVKNHEDELKGHIIRLGPPRGTVVDDEGQKILERHLIGSPIVVSDNRLEEEIERLQAENERLRDDLSAAKSKAIELLEQQTQLTERAISAEAARALADTTAADQAEKVRDLTDQLDRLKGRSLWARITRRFE